MWVNLRCHPGDQVCARQRFIIREIGCDCTFFSPRCIRLLPLRPPSLYASPFGNTRARVLFLYSRQLYDVLKSRVRERGSAAPRLDIRGGKLTTGEARLSNRTYFTLRLRTRDTSNSDACIMIFHLQSATSERAPGLPYSFYKFSFRLMP